MRFLFVELPYSTASFVIRYPLFNFLNKISSYFFCSDERIWCSILNYCIPNRLVSYIFKGVLLW